MTHSIEERKPEISAQRGPDPTGHLAQAEACTNHGTCQVVTRPTPGLPAWLDLPALIVERVLREIYWHWAGLRRWRQRKERKRRPAIQECSREALRTHLRAIGVTSGALVLLHTRVTGVAIHSGDASVNTGILETSAHLLSDIIDLLGPGGTLAMPTNARYQTDDFCSSRSRGEVITYDPSRSPSDVGLVNELFWRRKGVQRSLFPFNMLAACGPMADELLRDNLNERNPTAHGVDSGYYRICQHNGLVVSIGLPLGECSTLAHVVEDVRTDWPISDFRTERRYRVVQGGIAKEWTVRLVREEFDRFCHCRRKMARDLVAEGVIHEGSVGTVRVDWARASEFYEFFWRKTAKHPYPYYGIWLTKKTWRKES